MFFSELDHISNNRIWTPKSLSSYHQAAGGMSISKLFHDAASCLLFVEIPDFHDWWKSVNLHPRRLT